MGVHPRRLLSPVDRAADPAGPRSPEELSSVKLSTDCQMGSPRSQGFSRPNSRCRQALRADATGDLCFGRLISSTCVPLKNDKMLEEAQTLKVDIDAW